MYGKTSCTIYCVHILTNTSGVFFSLYCLKGSNHNYKIMFVKTTHVIDMIVSCIKNLILIRTLQHLLYKERTSLVEGLVKRTFSKIIRLVRGSSGNKGKMCDVL